MSDLFNEKTIPEFQGEYRWLSNFWPAIIKIGNHQYPTVENAYQAAKTGFSDPRFSIITAAEAKRLGGQLPMNENWNARKLAVMRALLMQKFAPGTELGLKLDETGDAFIIEGNTWGDTFWGAVNGKGQNHLGRLIMEIREENRFTMQPKEHWNLSI